MKKIMICSGAGLSAESGIPTFRDSGGLWENHNLEEVCYMKSFLPNYIKVNEFYNQRRKQLAKAEPNAAHFAIAELSKKHTVINITTNVDDLMERAGCTDVIHLHGILTQIRTNFGTPEEKVLDIGYKEDFLFEKSNFYPVKPNVVFFGEIAPRYEDLYDHLYELCPDDTMLIIGSSEQVVEFGSLARDIARFRGKIIVVNNDPKMRSMERTHQATVYTMKATEFFNLADLDNIL